MIYKSEDEIAVNALFTAAIFEVNPDLKQIKEVKGVYLFTNE